jgi:hypothetical protein
MRQINRNLFPRDGFYFKESDGITIRGDTWPGVIKRVENYRKRNNFPIGNVEQEVISQACARNPGYCTEENAAYTAEVQRASLKSRLLIWMARRQQTMQSHPPKFVTDGDFRARAAICAGCPKNQSLPEGCASSKAAVNESRKNIIGGRTQDARLNACAVLAVDLNSSVWLDEDRVDDGELPGHCWRKVGV